MSQTWFSSFVPNENSQLKCDASHRNKKTQSCLGQQCTQGHHGACLVSVGALQRQAGCGCGCSDRSQGYSVQLQQSPTWSVSCARRISLSGSSGCGNPSSPVLTSSACNFGHTPSCYSSLACGNSRLTPVPHLKGWKIQLSVCCGEAWRHPQALVMFCSWRCSEWDVNQDTWS